MNKIIDTAKKYILSFVMIVTSTLYFIDKLINFSVNTKIISIILYTPFIIAFGFLLYQIVTDFRKKEFKIVFSLDNVILISLIVFIVFYSIVFIVRLITRTYIEDIMESAHYAIKFAGSIGIYLVFRKINIDKSLILKNLLIFISYIDLLLIIDFIRTGNIRKTKILINIIFVCCLLLLYMLVSYLYLSQEKKYKSKFYNIVCFAHIIVTNSLIWLSGSRLMLFLGIATDFIFCIFLFKDKKTLFKSGVSILGSFFFIAILYMFNLGNTRFSVDKQLVTIFPNIQSLNVSESNDNYFDDGKYAIEISDDMRSYLINLGKDEIKKNFWFGTGNVLYDYDLNGEIIEQSSHNGFLESIIAFGFVGAIIQIIIAGSICINILIDKINFKNKIISLFALIIFGGFSLVQPTMYNIVILPQLLLFLSVNSLKTNE